MSGVGSVEVAGYFVGLHDWTSYAFRQWPDLLQRFSLLFPFVLVLAVLVARRWRHTRSSLTVAALDGAYLGILVSVVSLLLAQARTAPDRSRLATSAADFPFEFALIQLVLAVAGTLGWLRGALSGVLCVVLDRLAKKLKNAGR